MCRHLAYLGRPAPLAALLLDAPHSLREQSYSPRLQRHGTVNADGFGVGWYVAARSEPVRYRRAQPIWSDASFASLAPTIEAGCVLAAVRSASPGMPVDECCTAPFTHGRWLFSHNGQVRDVAGVRKRWASELTGEALAPVDSAVLFGLALARWQSGRRLGDGLVAAVADVANAGGGRLNLLAADGRALAATAVGDTLYFRTGDGSVVLASEPTDTLPGWTEVPDGSLVEADQAGVTITPLELP